MWTRIPIRAYAMEPQIYLIGGIASLLMGATLGVFGAGGSILTVPLLVFIFHIAPQIATQYSLLIVGIVSAFGLWRDRNESALPLKDLLKFTFPAMLGMFFMRSKVLPNLPKNFNLPVIEHFSLDSFILFIFSFFMIAASLSMIFIKPKTSDPNRKASSFETIYLVFIALIVGMATGFVGAGGGFLIVPALVFLTKMPISERK